MNRATHGCEICFEIEFLEKYIFYAYFIGKIISQVTSVELK